MITVPCNSINLLLVSKDCRLVVKGEPSHSCDWQVLGLPQIEVLTHQVYFVIDVVVNLALRIQLVDRLRIGVDVVVSAGVVIGEIGCRVEQRQRVLI